MNSIEIKPDSIGLCIGYMNGQTEYRVNSSLNLVSFSQLILPELSNFNNSEKSLITEWSPMELKITPNKVSLLQISANEKNPHLLRMDSITLAKADIPPNAFNHIKMRLVEYALVCYQNSLDSTDLSKMLCQIRDACDGIFMLK